MADTIHENPDRNGTAIPIGTPVGGGEPENDQRKAGGDRGPDLGAGGSPHRGAGDAERDRRRAIARERAAATRERNRQRRDKLRAARERRAGIPPRPSGPGPTNTSAPRVAQTKTPLDLIDVKALAQQVQGWHAVGAHLLRLPELAITEAEAFQLTEASINLVREYDLTVSPRTAAWIAFVGAAGIVYVPRAIQIQSRIQRQRAEAEEKRRGEPQSVN